jgi:hypothetical protein
VQYPARGKGGVTVGSPVTFSYGADAAVFKAVSIDGSDLLRAGGPGAVITGATGSSIRATRLLHYPRNPPWCLER